MSKSRERPLDTWSIALADHSGSLGGERGRSRVGSPGALEGGADAERGDLVEGGGDDLHPDRQPVSVRPAGDDETGKTGHADRDQEAPVGEDDVLAVAVGVLDVDPQGV